MLLSGLVTLPHVCVFIVCVQSERMQKLQLEDLREFLQEELVASFLLPDDVVIEQLQVAMSELRSKKLDQPPPGLVIFLYSFNSFFQYKTALSFVSVKSLTIHLSFVDVFLIVHFLI